ncbi:MAG: hypothetical protein KatS3mg068_2491 [Candidatus Sericytochromatia bacterium]|nr:MAG: hypothetical protein KatS3mg068_2491 [Candidatus Sericytochromatia bacterium]
MNKIILNDINIGLPGVTSSIANCMIEACIVSLDEYGHNNNCILKVKTENDIKEYIVNWDKELTEQIRRSWNDKEEAIEYGASCIGILLTLKLTDYTIILRSAKKTGIDYWLGYEKDILDFKARLEISGIGKESSNNSIDKRLKIKEEQVKKSDNSNLPVFIAILEFSKPEARYLKK